MSKKNKIKIIIPQGATTSTENGLVELTRQLRLKTGDSGGFGLGGRDGYGINYENKVFVMRLYSEGYECDCGWDKFYDEDKFKEKHSEQCYQSLVDVELKKAGWKKNKYDYFDNPKNLSFDESEKVENKIRKKYCKQFNLSFPGGCGVHCTCGRDKKFEKWHIEQIRKFKSNITELDEYGYPECHKKTCALILPNFLYKPTECEIRWYKYVGRDQQQKGKLPKDWLENCIKSLWEKGDCWYEFDMGLRDFSECLTGRQEPSKIYLCFDATNSETIVEAELSPFTENNVDYWGLDAILSDIANAQMEETKEYKKALALDKKYPALREKIRIDAINNCKYQIEWNKHRVKKLEKK